MSQSFLWFLGGIRKEISILLVAFCVFFPISIAIDSNSSNLVYTAISSSEISPSSTYPIVTTLQTANAPVRFRFSISYGKKVTKKNTIAYVEETLKPDEQKLISLNIPALELNHYKLSVRVFELNGAKEISKIKTISLQRQESNSIILIQSDKAICKPGETIRFRVFLLSRELKPFNTSKTVDIEIKDAQRNVVKFWKSAEIKAKRGFISESLQISSDPNLGDWTVEVKYVEQEESKNKPIVISSNSGEDYNTDEDSEEDEADGNSSNISVDSVIESPDEETTSEETSEEISSENIDRYRPKILTETVSFSVEQYVLPKYKVDVKLSPTFVTYNDSQITAQVSAVYTFGKPVSGKCTLTLHPNEHGSYYEYGGYEGGLGISAKTIKKLSKVVILEQGSGFIEFDVTKEMKILPHASQRDLQLDYTIDISCVDSASAKVQNTSASFRIYKLPYKAEILSGDSKAELKPGLPYFVKVRLTYQDGRPVEADLNPMALKIEHPFNLSSEDSVLYSPIRNDLGEWSETFQVPSNPLLSYDGIVLTYKNLRQKFQLGKKVVFPNGNYLHLSHPSKFDPKELDQVSLSLYLSQSFPGLNLLVISQRKILHHEILKFKDNSLNQQLNFVLPKGSYPSVSVLVYTIAPETNDVVSDSIKFSVRRDIKNLVQLFVSTKNGTVEPGSKTTIEVKGLPNSIFGIQAIDTSILILSKGDEGDLTSQKLNAKIQGSYSYSYGYGGTEVGNNHQHISRTGLNLLTNAAGVRSEESLLGNEGWGAYSAYGGYGGYYGEYGSGVDYGYNGPKKGKKGGKKGQGKGPTGYHNEATMMKPRSKYPTTWIWEEIESPTGEATLEKIVPDTISTWTLSAFQMNAQEGLGLTTSPSELTVFQPFFLSLNVPYSIVRGEVLELQVIIYNYVEDPVEAEVSMENDSGFFTFLENETLFRQSKIVTLNASSISVVTFAIRATKLGMGNLKVDAITLTDTPARDAVNVPLIVRPPGIKHTHNDAVIFNLLEESTIEHKISPVFPDRRVQGADSLTVSVFGDIFSTSVSNLEHFLDTSGSVTGEQNMLKFATSIAHLEYLNATGEITPEIEERNLQYLSSGYQRQLKFLLSDGSFSNFDKRNVGGSTWLTAFTARSLIQAKKLGLYVDNDIIVDSLRFLERQQDEDDGNFDEKGSKKWYSGYSKDEKLSQLTLTAFVLLTFETAQKAGIDFESDPSRNKRQISVSEVISKGTKFILHETSQQSLKDPFCNALISYLFAELNMRADAEKYFKLTQEAAKIELKSGLKHWEPIFPRRHPAYKMIHIKASSVQTTGYAVLTSILLDKNVSNGTSAAARWLLKNLHVRDYSEPTQEVIVGISALASFARILQAKNNNPATEMTIDLQLVTESSMNLLHDFHISNETKNTLQEFSTPLNFSNLINNEVTLSGRGNGTALAQVMWSYYTEDEQNVSSSLSLKIDAKSKKKGRVLALTICNSIARGEKTDLAILELKAPSGYMFDKEELETVRGEEAPFRRYETKDKDSQVTFYFDSISNKDKCFSVKAYRSFLVAQPAKATAVLYDYYDSTRRTEKFYTVPEAVTLCELCGSDHSCKFKNCDEKLASS